MAQDWMKIRLDLRDDPDVIAMAGQLGIDEDTVVGKLNRFWSWANRQTADGNAPGVTLAWLDRYVGVTGFGDALLNVGWLAVDGGGLSIPNFERHMSESAKQRALTARRAAAVRGKKRNASSVTESAPREEKEKSKNTKKIPTVSKKAKSVPIPGPLNTEAFRTAWKGWLKYRRGRRLTMTPETLTGQLAKLVNLGTVEAAVEEINQAITNGWQSVCYRKDGSHGRSPNTARTSAGVTHDPNARGVGDI